MAPLVFGQKCDVFSFFFRFPSLFYLLEWDEARGVGSTDTWPSVFNWFVCNTELPQVVSDHLRLDFDRVEGFTVIDTDDGSDHFRRHDHVSEMGFHLEEFFGENKRRRRKRQG